jgi:hypothetical protein
MTANDVKKILKELQIVLKQRAMHNGLIAGSPEWHRYVSGTLSREKKRLHQRLAKGK